MEKIDKQIDNGGPPEARPVNLMRMKPAAATQPEPQPLEENEGGGAFIIDDQGRRARKTEE